MTCNARLSYECAIRWQSRYYLDLPKETDLRCRLTPGVKPHKHRSVSYAAESAPQGVCAGFSHDWTMETLLIGTPAC